MSRSLATELPVSGNDHVVWSGGRVHIEHPEHPNSTVPLCRAEHGARVRISSYDISPHDVDCPLCLHYAEHDEAPEEKETECPLCGVETDALAFHVFRRGNGSEHCKHGVKANR